MSCYPWVSNSGIILLHCQRITGTQGRFHESRFDPEDFKFAVFGDHRGNSLYLKPLLRDIDKSKEMAFAIDGGDLVNVGKRDSFNAFSRWCRRTLRFPCYGDWQSRYPQQQFEYLSGDFWPDVLCFSSWPKLLHRFRYSYDESWFR